ncbi:hypothetical protein [Paracidovorax konjaci]|uniref:Uncharacterized protein n=1 Tax=Paracidovorax konjaci TaxID=32040 RepID=A0A1I1U620_9BURK|nr:hypothetical protein [Paracidovorax konjaci]SFD63330.1 hypothetical protein SAMN04489710_104144 [Paracidovorax konjaci]
MRTLLGRPDPGLFLALGLRLRWISPPGSTSHGGRTLTAFDLLTLLALLLFDRTNPQVRFLLALGIIQSHFALSKHLLGIPGLCPNLAQAVFHGESLVANSLLLHLALSERVALLLDAFALQASAGLR